MKQEVLKVHCEAKGQKLTQRTEPHRRLSLQKNDIEGTL